MPAAVPFVVAAVFGNTVVGSILTIASALAIGAYQKRRAEKEAREAFLDSLQDRNITIRSAVSARTYVLGTCRTSGAVVYVADDLRRGRLDGALSGAQR